ncbi:hypothetical protein GGR50DRAFT_539845 [Xylaria sp. CBS 124048]|nr:hypothetical protein GGR50DRAFT_539845 [Xylaria sp. CBS 124048]
MASRAPPLLESYLRLPHETSLILLSGVLGSSTNWLVHRYLCSFLSSPSLSSSSSVREAEYAESVDGKHTGVVFVSFLRDYAFWKDGCRRLGLDLDAAGRKGSFVFVDGLTGLFTSQQAGQGRKQPADDILGKRVLIAPTISHLRQTLEDAVARVQRSSPGTQTVLILDQPDFLLASAGDTVSGQHLRDTIIDFREKVHSCIVTISADEPLITAQGTVLEKEHAALALSLAHDAHLVMSLRVLETGTAKDVSGVLRVTPGGDDGIAGRSMEDRELLYFIGGDGSARVFERGQ